MRISRNDPATIEEDENSKKTIQLQAMTTPKKMTQLQAEDGDRLKVEDDQIPASNCKFGAAGSLYLDLHAECTEFWRCIQH